MKKIIEKSNVTIAGKSVRLTFIWLDAAAYAGYIFSTFDQDEDGHVTFDQFITGMSVLSRGTMPQKLRWVFNLYDLNGSGRISKSNLKDIISSVNQMLGTHAKPLADEVSTKQHVERMFQVIFTAWN